MTPTQRNTADIHAILRAIETIVDEMHLPVHTSDRIKAMLWKIRDAKS